MHLQYGFPNRQGTEELPHLGVSWRVGNTDDDAGSFLSMEFPGNCHHIGGGKPLPSTVPPVRHDGALESTEHAASCHRTVIQGDGGELPMAGRRGYTRECGEGLTGLQKTAWDGHLI